MFFAKTEEKTSRRLAIMTALLQATCLDGEKTLTVFVSTVVSVGQSETLMCLQNM